MARARNIKPGFFTNDELGELSPLARLAFIGLWSQADFNGNMKCKPKRLKVEILPYDNVDFGGLIDELELSGFVFQYQVQGDNYLHVVNFQKHQRPHKNEVLRGTDIPEPVTQCGPNGPDPEQSRSETEQERDENRSNPPDTGYRIPDTGYPQTDTSEPASASDDTQPDLAKQVIAYLNEKAQRNFKAVQSNTKLISARAREGATLDDFIGVIDRKCMEWANNPGMSQYLRPATLFNAEKFNNYVGQLGSPMPVSNLVDGTSRFAGRPSVEEQNREVAMRWASGGDFYDQE